MIPAFSWKMPWAGDGAVMLVTWHGHLDFKKLVGNHPCEQFQCFDFAPIAGLKRIGE